MKTSLARPADEIETMVKTYGNMLFRLCLVMLGAESDAASLLHIRACRDTLDE